MQTALLYNLITFTCTILRHKIATHFARSQILRQPSEFFTFLLFTYLDYRGYTLNLCYQITETLKSSNDGQQVGRPAPVGWIGSIKAPPCVHKLTAYIEPYGCSNNMIESSFHLFKNDFLKREHITNEKQLSKKMDEFIAHCHNRYFGEHYGITPAQILNGEQPDKHKFTAQIKQAAIDRRNANKNFKGCSVPAC